MNEKATQLVSAIKIEVEKINKIHLKLPARKNDLIQEKIRSLQEIALNSNVKDFGNWISENYKKFIETPLPIMSSSEVKSNSVLLGTFSIINYGEFQRLCLLIKEIYQSIYICSDVFPPYKKYICSKDQIHPLLSYISPQNNIFPKDTEVFAAIPSANPNLIKIVKGKILKSSSMIESDYYSIKLENGQIHRTYVKFITKAISPYEKDDAKKEEFLKNPKLPDLLIPYSIDPCSAHCELNNLVTTSKRSKIKITPFYTSAINTLSSIERSLTQANFPMLVKGELPIYLRRPPPELMSKSTSISLRRPDTFDDERTVIHLQRLVYDEDSL
ncbi:hypothetical protein TVAG_061820 [Trichomonas vaginalis G3]|uniref:Uncharacterized protein n=1 Tax=Trichomonas vaginalis (strain ATCC PRA-98 / G3) TaxID=412133 RepID=A2E7U7_TRIV3|nr:hypothetical protein TVAGG3_0282690 [Trichomonas vaginalis G3]EAY11278.1 hypothetical protein TVAG_061820 [Trichomonas vaginalis G3]KAI5526680.1 hypothetical protein TVAGG3_0282690 [Trichomonas vaginalis G3]|eukprot:XP_001323501.1 hypothetical protein [Trichomonas vaginalis G3]